MNVEKGDLNACVPNERCIVPVLRDRVQPVHAVGQVDYMPGCPPPADRIRAALQALIDGREPVMEGEMNRSG